MKHIVHENSYRRMSADELQMMLEKNCNGREYLEWIRAFCDRKYNSDFAKEMCRSVAEYIREYI